VDDALAAYRSLIEQRKIAPGSIAIAGDSAGGGLTAVTLLSIRQAGLPMPGAAVCISPWTDLTCSAPSYRDQGGQPIRWSCGRASPRWRRTILGAADPRTPLASPVFADLRGLPPMLIQVGSEEVLLDDATRLAERARAAGVDATIEVWDSMIHVWHWFLPWLDEAQSAVDKIGAFLARAARVSRANGRPIRFGALLRQADNRWASIADGLPDRRRSRLSRDPLHRSPARDPGPDRGHPRVVDDHDGVRRAHAPRA
jgi:phosphinothricin tripeptide acetyl hydrolase